MDIVLLNRLFADLSLSSPCFRVALNITYRKSLTDCKWLDFFAFIAGFCRCHVGSILLMGQGIYGCYINGALAKRRSSALALKDMTRWQKNDRIGDEAPLFYKSIFSGGISIAMLANPTFKERCFRV